MKARAWLVLLLLPATALPQSLGDAARQEAARRKKVQQEGKAAPVVGENALERAGGGHHADESTSATPVAPDASGPEAGSGLVGDAAQSRELDRERAQRERDEKMWRERVAAATARIAKARERYEAVKDRSLAPGQYLVDSRGRAVVSSPEQLQRIVADAKAELDAAEKALDDVMEAAQREGVPPGWLR